MLGDNQEKWPGLLFPVPDRREGKTDHCCDAQGVSCAHTDGHTCPGVTEVHLHYVLSHGTDMWDFSRNRKYMDYELDSKDVWKGVLWTSYRAELKYCHFAGCKPKYELPWLQRGWPHVISHGKTDFCPKGTKPKLQFDLVFFIQRTHHQFHWLLSDESMPCVNPEVKIQI